MSLFNNIINGWANYIFENPEIEKLAKKRAAICANCPNAVKSKFWNIFEDKEVKGVVCNMCGCPLFSLLRSEQEKCKLNKW